MLLSYQQGRYLWWWLADSAVGFRASFYGYLLPLLLMVDGFGGCTEALRNQRDMPLRSRPWEYLIPYYVGALSLEKQTKKQIELYS